mmetsp:Transcript_14553/g.45132  ORF Transcript_14553/g.45132 Transcript_14553/m.45132 type:complete len:219 (-) Transcript_14553:30-686(-)
MRSDFPDKKAPSCARANVKATGATFERYVAVSLRYVDASSPYSRVSACCWRRRRAMTLSADSVEMSIGLANPAPPLSRHVSTRDRRLLRSFWNGVAPVSSFALFASLSESLSPSSRFFSGMPHVVTSKPDHPGRGVSAALCSTTPLSRRARQRSMSCSISPRRSVSLAMRNRRDSSDCAANSRSSHAARSCCRISSTASRRVSFAASACESCLAPRAR